MFCKNCGIENVDGVKFCKGCGQTLSPPADVGSGSPVFQPVSPNVNSQVAPTSFAPKSSFKLDNKKIGIIVSAFVLVVILAFGVSFLTGGAERAAKNYAKALYSGNFEKADGYIIVDAVEYYEEEFDWDKEEMADEYEDRKHDFDDDMEDEYGDRYRVSKVKVDDSDKLSNKKAQAREDSYVDSSGDYLKKKHFDKVVEVDLEITVKGSDDEDTEDVTIYVAKSGGKWYVLRTPTLYGYSYD